MLDLLVYLFLLIIIFIVFGSAVYASFRASPWLPVFKKDIERILKIADIKEGDVVLDLGSGDGRILVAVANNTKAKLVRGYEISIIPYVWSRMRLLFLDLPKDVEVRLGDFLNKDLSCADVIFCFLTPMAMKKLEPKFRKELKKGTTIISYSFSIPNWTKAAADNNDEYRIPIYKYVVD